MASLLRFWRHAGFPLRDFSRSCCCRLCIRLQLGAHRSPPLGTANRLAGGKGGGVGAPSFPSKAGREGARADQPCPHRGVQHAASGTNRGRLVVAMGSGGGVRGRSGLLSSPASLIGDSGCGSLCGVGRVAPVEESRPRRRQAAAAEFATRVAPRAACAGPGLARIFAREQDRQLVPAGMRIPPGLL